jgi:type VI secretion system protein ImpJ
MPDLRVHSHEGRFLRPQRMPAADHHRRASQKASEDWSHPFPWGLRRIDIDREEVRNGSLVLLAARTARPAPPSCVEG